MNKIASVKTINGKATVTIDTDASHEVIDVQNGACLVMVKGFTQRYAYIIRSAINDQLKDPQ